MSYPRGRRAPYVNNIKTSGDSTRAGNGPTCPVDGIRMVFDKIKIRNWLCPNCLYELPKQEPAQQQTTGVETLSASTESTLSTIDGYVDQGGGSFKTNTTARFRPVDTPRASPRQKENMWNSPTARELESRGLVVTDSREFLPDSHNASFDTRAHSRYDSRGRRLF